MRESRLAQTVAVEPRCHEAESGHAKFVWRDVVDRLDLVRVGLSLLLTVSAALKARQLVADSVTRVDSGLLDSVLLRAGVALGEILLAGWLLSGWHPRAARMASFVTFTAFAGVALYQISRGAESCGCFGSLAFSPWQALIVDLTALAAIWLCWPFEVPTLESSSAGSARPPWVRRLVSCIPLLFLAMTLGWGIAVRNLTGLESDGRLPDEGIVLLRPRDWLGGRFPLSRHTNLGSQLDVGRWTVILYHHDCPKCQALISQCASTSSGNSPLALIELPPFDTGLAPLKSRPGLVHSRLRDDREWFAATPVRVTLDGGYVIDVVVD